MNRSQEYTFSCYSPLLGQYQLMLLYCGKGRQNFASNITLYPCERSRQNHLVLAMYEERDVESTDLDGDQLDDIHEIK